MVWKKRVKQAPVIGQRWKDMLMMAPVSERRKETVMTSPVSERRKEVLESPARYI